VRDEGCREKMGNSVSVRIPASVGITDENRNDAVETGAPRGREFW
jgi:antitoxin component of MazEF toxin-antitoxin module